MIIWLVTIGEPLPVEGENVRLLRTGLLAKQLEEKGHEVVWWSSSFDHTRKEFHSETGEEIRPSNSLTLILLKSIGYRDNISIRRLVDNIQLSFRYYFSAKKKAPPNIIVSSIPIVELSLVNLLLRKRNNVSLVVDCRDMWPDIFTDSLPTWKKMLAQPLIFALSKCNEIVFKDADAIFAMTRSFLNWGLSYADRELNTEKDAIFPFGYPTRVNLSKTHLNENQITQDLGILNNSEIKNICFFGFLGDLSKYDFDEIFKFLKSSDGSKYRLIMCGSGEGLTELKKRCSNIPNIIFPGWVTPLQMQYLSSISIAGLIPYRNRKDFLASVPNKVIEYIQHKLFVISCLSGETLTLLTENRAGKYFENSEDLLTALKIAETLKNDAVHQAHLDTVSKNYSADNVYSKMADRIVNIARTNQNSKGT